LEIRDLEPDLIVANMEENNQQVVEDLEREGWAVWITFPRTTQDVIDLLHAIVNLFRLRNPAFQIATLEMTLEWTKLAVHSPIPFFCPIWTHPPLGSESWLMTFNRDTYASDILQVCGGENIFSQRERRYPLAADISGAEPEDPGTRDTRYPRVTLEEIRAAQPEVILLPDEPFPFRQEHQTELLDLLKDTPAVERGRVWGVDGRLITWHGTYMAKALTELPRYFNLS
jgi:ABC-type Fe3+-hydroxamate transport system substrate-binding protein